MTVPPSAVQAALDHYNAHFDPTTYRAFREAVSRVLDQHGELTDSALSGWMNQLTDAALGIAGHSNYADSPQRLAVALGQFPATDEILHTAAAHLRTFARAGEQVAEEVAVTAQLVRDLVQTPVRLTTLLDLASIGHLTEHRAAAHLLAAADLLLRAAHSLVSRQMPSYTAEKARRARDHVSWGFQTLTEHHDYAYYFRPLSTSITTTGVTPDA